MAASLLDRVAPADPVTFPLTVSALVLVAAAAGYVPALRAE